MRFFPRTIRSRRRSPPSGRSLLVLRRPLALLAVGLLLLAGCRMFRRGERPPYRKVTPPVAFEILRDSPDILILDLRSREEFLGDTGHIYTALNIPLERLAERLVEIGPYR